MSWAALPRRAKLRWARRGVLALTCVILLAYLLRAVLSDHANNVATVLRRASVQGAVVVTASNFMYRRHLRNFQCALRRLSLPYAPVVFALDLRTHAFAKAKGMASVAVSEDRGDDVQPGRFERKGPRSFSSITRQKIAAVLPALKAGLDVLVSDADIHWCGDAVREVQSLGGVYASADVMIMPEAEYRILNSGFYYVRANERTLKLFVQLVENSEFGNHDQDVVNAVFCTDKFGARKIEEVSVDGVPFWCVARDGAEIRVLPGERFPSGAQIVKGKGIFEYNRDELQEMCEKRDFVVLHNNFVKASKKMARAIVKGMWFVERGEHGFIENSDENDNGFDDRSEMRCLERPAPAGSKAKRLCGKYCFLSAASNNTN